MARPMRTPVKWDRGSVSVAPIAQPFKGILEDFGIPESAYSAEGGFGGSGLLDWEPADFISPDVIWGTKYVSDAPPPSHYMNGDDENGENGDTCTYGKKADGTCKPKPEPEKTCLERGLCADCSSPPCDDDGGDPCDGVDCSCSDGSSRGCENGNCIGSCPEDGDKCSDTGECGTWPDCGPCVDPCSKCHHTQDCIDGKCIDPEKEIDPCDKCASHQDCVNGQCVDPIDVDPCAGNPCGRHDCVRVGQSGYDCVPMGECDADEWGTYPNCYPKDPGQDDTLDEEDEWTPKCSDYGEIGIWPSCYKIDWDDSGGVTWT
jgi:hypothetical protein